LGDSDKMKPTAIKKGARGAQPKEKMAGGQGLAQISSVAENYLVAMYTMRLDGGPVTMTRLSEQLKLTSGIERLGTSLPSVTGMIRRMKKAGLIDLGPNKEVFFTTLGEKEAEAVFRRHQLAERMLTDIIGLELPKVNLEAHRLEHAISPEVEAKLVQRLGNPITCPFGHPIPGTGYVAPANMARLNQVEPGTAVVVERIPEDDPQFVEYLVVNSVLPGQNMFVSEIAPYKGTLTMNVAGKEVVMGLHVAARIWVRPVPKD